MISYNLMDANAAEYLVNVCRKFHEDIDIIYQRQIIDGKSMLGVMSLIGHIVAIKINTNDDDVKHALEMRLYQ